MRAIFFPVQSYQIRRQNRQRFRGVRLLTPNSFLNDRTAQTDRTKRKRTLPYGRHIESGRKGAKSSFRLKCRFTSSSDLALFAQDAGAKPLYCSSDSVPSNSSRMPRTTPARAAITIMALIRTTIHFVFCIGGALLPAQCLEPIFAKVFSAFSFLYCTLCTACQGADNDRTLLVILLVWMHSPLASGYHSPRNTVLLLCPYAFPGY